MGAAVGLGGAGGGSGGDPAQLPRRQLLGGARAGGHRQPSWKRLTPVQGHSSTPRHWQKEILSGFFFCFFFFLFFCLFFGVFCFLKEKYSEDTRKRIKKREKGKRC